MHLTCTENSRGWVSSILRGLVLIWTAVALAACGGGGGSNPTSAAQTTTNTETGTLVISLTDAPGDFVTYTVDVNALTLTRSNGDVVETLPAKTRVDFAELTDITELLTIATVPAGDYISATLLLDFSAAEVVIQDDTGEATLANLQDRDGNALGLLETRLELTTSEHIRIRPGIPAAFSLDFDLDASNSIDPSVTPPVVTVEPFLLATPALDEDREHRVRGVLEDVDTSANTFNVQIRPFQHRNGRFGEIEVFVSETTQYEVDGITYVGAAGLEALQDLAENAPMISQGQVAQTEFTASWVVAGSSVPWSDASVVRGIVIARNENTLTIRGASLELSSGERVFRETFTIDVNSETNVSAFGFAEVDLTEQSISVGQKIYAWGEQLDDQSLLAERVHLSISQLNGQVVQVQPLAVDLSLINGRRPEIYDFSGTGITPAEDADANFYEIRTGTLPLNTLSAGDWVRVRGWVSEFATAPADFWARSIINIDTSARAASLWVDWPSATGQPFSATAGDRLDLLLNDARKALWLRGIPDNLADELDTLAMVATQSGQGVFALQVRGSGTITLFRNFTEFVQALVEQLDSGNNLKRIHAHGSFNTDNGELITQRAGFVFVSPETGG